MLGLLWLLLIGLAAGWIASRIMGAGKPGILGLLLVGVLGSFIGGFLFRLAGFKISGFPADLIAAVVGAIVCIAAIRYWGRKF